MELVCKREYFKCYFFQAYGMVFAILALSDQIGPEGDGDELDLLSSDDQGEVVEVSDLSQLA